MNKPQYASQVMQVFDYLETLDCFVENQHYAAIARYLGLIEWSSVVWLGRYFTLDNDYGEHWFDNWEERERLEQQYDLSALGYDASDLLIIDPDRFSNGVDGPCYPAALRKLFWTDVLKSLTVSLDLIFAEARYQKARTDASGISEQDEPYILDLEQRIRYLQTLSNQ